MSFPLSVCFIHFPAACRVGAPIAVQVVVVCQAAAVTLHQLATSDSNTGLPRVSSSVAVMERLVGAPLPPASPPLTQPSPPPSLHLPGSPRLCGLWLSTLPDCVCEDPLQHRAAVPRGFQREGSPLQRHWRQEGCVPRQLSLSCPGCPRE